MSDERVDGRAERRRRSRPELRALLANGDFDRYWTYPSGPRAPAQPPGPLPTPPAHSHQNEAGPNDETTHLDDEGVFINEQDGDDVKLLGIYSSEAVAEERIRCARLLPSFADEPDCFQIGEYDLDEDHWTEGVLRVPVQAFG